MSKKARHLEHELNELEIELSTLNEKIARNPNDDLLLAERDKVYDMIDNIEEELDLLDEE